VIAEKILLVLSKYQTETFDNFTGRPEVTQDGIASALGITRAHAAVSLKPLVANGLVHRYLSHCGGSRGVRRACYRLEPIGIKQVDLIRSWAEREGVAVDVTPSKRAIRESEKQEIRNWIKTTRYRLDEIEKKIDLFE